MGKKATGGGIGEYIIRIVNERGEQAGDDLHCLSRTRCPNVGEYVVIRDAMYVVATIIHHEADPARTRSAAPYTLPVLLVREAATPGAVSPPTTGTDAPNVLALDAKRAQLSMRSEETYYLPATLIAVLVCIGYREQATAFASRSRVAAELVYLGWTWFADPIAIDSKELWRLSRAARRSYGALDLVFDEIAGAGALASWDEPSLRASLPPSPPRLALVR